MATIGECIQKRDMDELIKTVEKAVKIYNADAPEARPVETAFGTLPFTAVFDEDTKWNVITAAYAEIVQAQSRIPKGADQKIETAKLIATNAVLRNLSSGASVSNDGLL